MVDKPDNDGRVTGNIPPETKKPDRLNRRNLLKGLAAASGVAAGLWLFGNKMPTSEEVEPSLEVDPQRAKDVQIFRDAVFTWIHQDSNRETYAKIFSDDFVNEKIPFEKGGVPEDRLQVIKKDYRINIDPKYLGSTQIGEFVSYSVDPTNDEIAENNSEFPTLRYSKTTYQGKDVSEAIHGKVGPDGKFTTPADGMIAPKTQEDAENEAVELRDRVKSIFKFTPEEWDQFNWELDARKSHNTKGVDYVGIRGTYRSGGTKYRLTMSYSGDLDLYIDHRPKNFGFPEAGV